MRKSNYDKRPVLHVRTKGVSAWQGWEAIGAQLRKAIAGKPDAVVCVDCYHGVWESDVLSALTEQLNPSHVFCTAQATLPKEQVNAMLKDHLTDDRVFGIMAHYRIEQFFDIGDGSSGGGSSSSTRRYDVSAPSVKNGTVTVSPKSASKGDTVTVTVKPDSGYVLETLTVTDKNGNELTLKDKGNGKYTFTMPAGKVEVKATFMEDNSMLNFFYDVPNNAYFYEAVKWAVENGITTGVGNDLFAPEQPCTRAQIVTFLWRAAGSPEPKGAASGMTDVVSGSYYEKAVAWAIENGITTGTTTSTFSPDATCTRAQAVTFLARALNAKAASVAEFSDVPTDSYFADAVAWAAANGVTEGIGGGLFGSDNDCTRGQIVTFLYRAYNK